MNILDSFFSLFSHDIGIDLGTANTLVWVKGKGIAIREPSVVAMHKKTKKVIAIGAEAKKMLGKTPASIITIRPLRGGVIADFDATAAMIAHYIKEVHQMGGILPFSLIHPKVVIGIPSAVTEVQRRAVWEAALSAGAREAYLIEEPMAAAIGAGMSVFQSTGVMVVDIGGGTTEIAIICLGGIVVSRSLKSAGDEMDNAILQYIRLRHGMLLGEKTVEELKIKIGTAYEENSKIKKSRPNADQPLAEKSKVEEENEKFTFVKVFDSEDFDGELSRTAQTRRATVDKENKVSIVRGRDLETGLPRGLKVTEMEVREALAPVLSDIVDGIVEVLEEAPPELTSDILEHGILLTGGGAKLPGLDRLIVERTRMPVILAEDPLTTVVRGTGKVLEDKKLLSRVKVTGGLK